MSPHTFPRTATRMSRSTSDACVGRRASDSDRVLHGRWWDDASRGRGLAYSNFDQSVLAWDFTPSEQVEGSRSIRSGPSAPRCRGACAQHRARWRTSALAAARRWVGAAARVDAMRAVSRVFRRSGLLERLHTSSATKALAMLGSGGHRSRFKREKWVRRFDALESALRDLDGARPSSSGTRVR